MLGLFGPDGASLVAVTSMEARPDRASVADTVATATSLPSGGQIVQPDAGRPEMTGGVLSILILTGTEVESPTPFVAEQVRVTPAVSAASAAGPQPEDEAMPDSGSLTLQLTLTELSYQPFRPDVPWMLEVMTGGEVSSSFRMKPYL